MKKIFIIIFLFFSCYFIYKETETDKLNYLSIGDTISIGVNEYGIHTKGYSDYVLDYLTSRNKLNIYDNTFSSKNYNIDDIKRILKYNEIVNNKSLNRLIKEADIITICLGMDEIHYIINDDIGNIYTSLDNMIKNYDEILKYITKLNNKKIIILGYYSVQNKYNDIYNYANYKLKKMCKKYNLIFINLDHIMSNNPLYLNKNSIFFPNNKGYELISQKIVEKIKEC